MWTMGGSSARRAGWVGAFLLAGSAGTAGVLVRVAGLDRAAAAVGLVGGIAGLYISWAGYRDGRANGAAATTLVDLTDQLAVGVRAQWETEAARRRLNDPYPLPVRWSPVVVALTDDWPVLETLASTGVGWPPRDPATRAGWATGPAGLAGVGGELIEVLTRVPTGRLVVLGEPGAGKTMLLVRLVLDLLARRPPGGPVPMLVSLASWNPEVDDLHSWLAGRISVDYPALASADPDGSGRSRARALLAAGLILAVLDGLDEIPAALQGAAIARINDGLRPGQTVVLSSRTAAFSEAVNPAAGVPVRLAGAAAIELCPLPAAAVRDYLRASAGGQASAARWTALLTPPAPGRTTPVLQTLTTPLMATLARTIYNPRPGEHSGPTLPDPEELADQGRFGSRTALEQHLFDAFIPAAYRRTGAPGDQQPRLREPWTEVSAQRYLRFLARHLQDRLQTTDLAWWHIARAAPRPFLSLTFGLAIGFIGSLAGVSIALLKDGVSGGAGDLLVGAIVTLSIGLLSGMSGLFVAVLSRFFPGWRPGVTAFVGGLTFTLIFDIIVVALIPGVVSRVEAAFVYGFFALLAAVPAAGAAAGVAAAPARAVRWRPRARALMWGLPAGLAGGLLAAYASGFDDATETMKSVGSPAAGASAAVGWWLAFGLAAMAVTGIQGAPVDPTVASSPRAVLSFDRRTARTITLVGSAGVVLAMTLWAVTTNVIGYRFFGGKSIGPFGAVHPLGYYLLAGSLLFAVPAGLAAGFLRAMWGPFLAARCWLAMRRRLPWRLMAFLADAHERGVLRQAGGVYQFRHAELQRRLAGR
jgi:NACHT domain